MKKITLLLALSLINLSPVQAKDRFSAGVGIGITNSQTSIGINAEYEHPLNKTWGLGAALNIFTSNPALFLIGAPEFFYHPFQNNIVLSAAPLILISSSTSYGGQIGARIPFALGDVHIMPTGYVAFIQGGPIYTFGLGLSI